MLNNETKKLHIAMIGQKHVPSREGGVEVVVWELSKRLCDMGYNVDCFNRAGYQTTTQKYVSVANKPGKYYKNIRMITVPTFRKSGLNATVYTLLATIRACFGGYDAIHFHAEGPCLLIWLPKLFGIKCVATIHGLDWQRAKWGGFATKVLKHGERNAALYADEIIVLSKNVQSYFWQKYGRTTHYIPNGINKPDTKQLSEITEELGIQPDGYIMSLSRIVPEKGIHYLLDAFKQVKTDKRLIIVGGDGSSRDYMNQMRAKAAEDPRVVMTGFKDGLYLEELLSNTYLYVLPSDIEGMAVSLLEAMSYGNACLVSDIDENIEVTGTDGQHALTFQKSNVDDLRDKLQYLINHPEVVEEQQKTAQDYICSRYSWDTMTKENEKLYART